MDTFLQKFDFQKVGEVQISSVPKRLAVSAFICRKGIEQAKAEGFYDRWMHSSFETAQMHKEIRRTSFPSLFLEICHLVCQS